ncbi:hypothetical protein G9A89_013834 [Geosiphon pyriformis]|nr:hypothetical protein G9A89_013834 [Geosiphon pyriformis]
MAIPINSRVSIPSLSINGAPIFIAKKVLSGIGPLNVLGSSSFMFVCNHLSWVGTGSLSVYIDGSLKSLGTVGYKAGTAVFFEDIDLGLGIGILSLMSSTLAEMQAIALALECVPLSSFVHLFSNS